MPERLTPEFPPVSTAEWDALVRKDLTEADYENLARRTVEGIPIKLYYRREDIERLGGLPDLVQREQPWKEAQDWIPPAGAIRADQFYDAWRYRCAAACPGACAGGSRSCVQATWSMESLSSIQSVPTTSSKLQSYGRPVCCGRLYFTFLEFQIKRLLVFMCGLRLRI